MTTVLFRKTSEVNGEKRFADPGNITHTLRVSVATSPKAAGKVSLTNNRFEYVESERPQVTNGTDNSNEVTSIRIIISGSTQNANLLKARVARAFANVEAMMDDKCLDGFIPTSDPVVSAVA